MTSDDGLVHELVQVFIQLGGQAHYSEIYTTIEKRGEIDLSGYVDWKAAVRGAIHECSRDAKAFRRKKRAGADLFYSVEGKGRGVWGLLGEIPKVT